MSEEQAQERIHGDRLAKLGNLFAGFAHEVRNPLSTIALNLGLIKEDLGRGETPQEKRNLRRLDILESEVRRLQNTVDDFLRYVRRPKLNLRATDFNAFVRDLVYLWTPDMGRKGISLRFYPGRVEPVQVDTDMMRGAVVNLLKNAREACGEGDEVLLATEATADGGLQLRFTDTGPGMPPDAVAQAFRPYYSTKSSGTGLGLPITARILEEHGGHIDMTSEPGRGTQFIVQLPGAPREAQQEAD